MIAVFLLLLLSLNAWIVIVFSKNTYRKEGLASPLAVVLLFYLLNYPLRAIMLFVAVGTGLEWEFNSWEWSFSRGEICVALFYASLFAVILITAYSMFSGQTKAEPNYYRREFQPSGLNTSWRRLVFFGFIGVYMLVFVYEAVSGELFSLYGNIEDMERPFLVNVLRLGGNLKWFLLAYAFVRIQRRKSWPIIILAASVTARVVISACVSTGKGDLVGLVLLWTICVWLVCGRISKYTFALGTVAVIAFAFYSFTARHYDYHDVLSAEGGSTLKMVRRTVETVASVHEADKNLWKEQAGRVFSRFNGLDGLILCQRRNRFLGDGLYAAGSLVELGNVVPRGLWPSRPHLSFNHHVTYAIWGKQFLSETPIGRIGESFYVLNWAGLLYAGFYAMIWKWMYQTFMLRSRNDVDTAFYLCVLFLVVFPDAYIVYNWKGLAVVAAAYTLLRFQLGVISSRTALSGNSGAFQN